MKKYSWVPAILLVSIPTLALAAGAVEGGAKQATNWSAIGMFVGFVALTLVITYLAAKRPASAADFWRARHLQARYSFLFIDRPVDSRSLTGLALQQRLRVRRIRRQRASRKRCRSVGLNLLEGNDEYVAGFGAFDIKRTDLRIRPDGHDLFSRLIAAAGIQRFSDYTIPGFNAQRRWMSEGIGAVEHRGSETMRLRKHQRGEAEEYNTP